MDHEFWHERWKNNQIGFHEESVNPLLAAHFHQLKLDTHARILLPLCGKSHDLAWLAQQAYQVIGIELSALAVEAFFKEQQLSFQTLDHGPLREYRSEGIQIFCGDIFSVSKTMIGPIQAIYDRAALVALPPEMRLRYAAHLITITDAAKQLLINFEYDQQNMSGPPFSVAEQEIHQLYGQHYHLSLLYSGAVAGKLKGTDATEKVWLFDKPK